MNQEYMERKKQRVVELAQGMLDGSIHYLEGSIELSSLRFEVGAMENDKDFIAFVAIASEIDDLPIGAPRQYWSEEALKRHESKIQEAIEWAKEFSMNQCMSLVERFSA